jgi:hypothetical protein
MQAAFALAVLVLPLMPMNCVTTLRQETICPRVSYIEMGGSLIGYAFLIAMIAIGVGSVVLLRVRNPTVTCAFRWLAVLASVGFVVVGSWSIGFLFLPGGVLMLIAARSCIAHGKELVPVH